MVNAHVAAREWRDDIVFLRKILPGRADRSYGIQVARLAGLPPEVIARAREILQGLERDELSRGGRPALAVPAGSRTDSWDCSRPVAADWPLRGRAEALLQRLRGAEPRRHDAAGGARPAGRPAAHGRHG